MPPGCPIVRAEPVWTHGRRRWLGTISNDHRDARWVLGPHVDGWRTVRTGRRHQRVESGRGWVDGAPSVAWECPCCGHIAWMQPIDDVTPPLFPPSQEDR